MTMRLHCYKHTIDIKYDLHPKECPKIWRIGCKSSLPYVVTLHGARDVMD